VDFVGTLQAGDRLTVNDQLWSTNRWFRLTMYPEGLLLVRNQVGFEVAAESCHPRGVRHHAG
jgi:hypothetical protein